MVNSTTKKTGNHAEAKALLLDISLICGDPWAKAIALAKNKEEREFILNLMMKENSNDEK